ncbi:hypothetical protein M3J09_001083 [Ascochyta lentis]
MYYVKRPPDDYLHESPSILMLLLPNQELVMGFFCPCASDPQDAEISPALVSRRTLCCPAWTLLTWGRVTQYRFLTSASKPKLTDLHTVLANPSSALQILSQVPLTRITLLQVYQVPRLCYLVPYLGVPHSKPRLHEGNLRAFRSPPAPSPRADDSCQQLIVSLGAVVS